jgi:AcrR family transcriptional regulator
MPRTRTSARRRRRGAYHHGELRQALLAAAEAELAAHGVEGFTLRGCAKRAGVSHAAPAHHFKDAGALLTALAAAGFARFAAAMETRRAAAAPEPRAELIAIGLGYVDFALANPALFRLMFASDRPDAGDVALGAEAEHSYRVLVDGLTRVRGSDPRADRSGAIDLAAAWAIVHGIAHLLLTGRARFLGEIGPAERERALAAIIARVLPAAAATSESSLASAGGLPDNTGRASRKRDA